MYRTVAGALQLAYLKFKPRAGTPKLSFCTCVKDRFDHLRQTLLENIEVCCSYSNVEFVLLDYDCPDPRTSKYVCQDLNHCINSGILTYYHFPEGKYFEPSHSRNLAFRLSTGDIICNVDADNFLGHGFARYVASMLGGKRIFLQGPVTAEV